MPCLQALHARAGDRLGRLALRKLAPSRAAHPSLPSCAPTRCLAALTRKVMTNFLISVLLLALTIALLFPAPGRAASRLEVAGVEAVQASVTIFFSVTFS